MVMTEREGFHVLTRSDMKDSAKRAGLGVSRRDRLAYTYGLCKYLWSHDRTTDQQYHQWLRIQRARRQLL